jgi:hypothetical protein
MTIIAKPNLHFLPMLFIWANEKRWHVQTTGGSSIRGSRHAVIVWKSGAHLQFGTGTELSISYRELRQAMAFDE